jgi:hypothetical protein
MLNEPTETKEEKRMRKAGGVLTIIGGVIGINIGIGLIIMIVTGEGMIVTPVEAAFIAFAIVALIVGIVALIGGIYALRARVWGFALAGGIVVIGIGAGIIGPFIRVVGEYLTIAIMWAPLILIGLLGTSFIALRKREFR